VRISCGRDIKNEGIKKTDEYKSSYWKGLLIV
jgi:hypothetical protein